MRTRTKTSRANRKRTSRVRPSPITDRDSGTAAVETVLVPFPMSGEAFAPPAHAVIVLEGDCTSPYAQSLKDSLLAQLEAEAVSIEAGAVERIDTACLQLLTAFVLGRQRAGQRVDWRGRSEIFLQSAALLGLTSVLDINAGS